MRLITAIILLLGTTLAYSQEVLTAEIIDATQENDCQDGSIDLTISGGFSPYDIIWDYFPEDPDEPPILDFHIANGIEGSNDGEDIDATAGSGEYTVLVTDALCGTASASFTVKCECPECELNAEVTNENCQNGNGSIVTSISCTSENEVATYTYQWSDLDSDDPQTSLRNNLSSGDYCLTVTDNSECTYTGCWTVENIRGRSIPELIEQNNITYCSEEGDQNCTGSLTIAVEEGVSINWVNIPNPNQTNSTTVTDLCEGTYMVEITKNGCEFTYSFNIECCTTGGQDFENSFPPLTIDLIEKISPVNSTSFDGVIEIDISGGSQEYFISWTGPNGFVSSNQSLGGLGPGEYCIMVDDGCSIMSLCITLVDCSNHNLSINGTVSNTCPGVSFGIIDLNITGGQAPFSFAWSDGGSTASISNLNQGQHCVTVTDNSGCVGFQIVECFTVGVSDHQFSGFITDPCGAQFTCNGNPTIFEPYNGQLNCNFENCDERTCRCPLTNGIVGDPIPFGYASTRISANNCAFEGLCLDGSGWEVISQGGFNTFFLPVSTGGCGNCIQCYEVETCDITIAGVPFRFIVSAEIVDVGACCGGCIQDDPECEFSFEEFDFNLRDLNQFSIDDVTLMPIELSTEVDMKIYNEFVGSKIENNDYIELREFMAHEMIDSIDWAKKPCITGGHDGENLVENNFQFKNILINPSIEVYPNPFTDQIIVDYNNSLDINSNFSYSIKNILGQTILEGKLLKNQSVIYTTSLNVGLYLLEVYENNEEILSEKLVKN